MNSFKRSCAAIALTASLTASLTFGAGASAATWDIEWTGSGGWTMTGFFTHDDALLNTGTITETQIDDLAISVFLNNALQGSRSLLGDGLGTTAAAFNFNFDTTAGAFITGGLSTGPSGQNWFTLAGGNSCDTIGFSSGSAFQGVCLNGSFLQASSIPIGSAIQDGLPTATLRDGPAVIPLPAAGWLLGLALAGLGILGRRRRTA